MAATAARLAWLCDSDSDSDGEGDGEGVGDGDGDGDDRERRVSLQKDVRLSPYHRSRRVHGI